jgi:hypothetical protein
MYAKLELFIDGQWLNGDGRRGEDIINRWNFPALTPARKIGGAHDNVTLTAEYLPGDKFKVRSGTSQTDTNFGRSSA